MTQPEGDGALVSVLDLERALEAKRAATADIEKRLEEARGEAERILATARERAGRRASERRRSLLTTAEAEAQQLAADAEDAADRLRTTVGDVEEAFVNAALALLLPDLSQETTCSSR